MSQDREYAYGDWKVDGVSCPVASAEIEESVYVDSVHVDTIATDFDNKVEAIISDPNSTGKISKETAKKALRELVIMYSRRAEKLDDEDNAGSKKLDIVKNILDKEFNDE